MTGAELTYYDLLWSHGGLTNLKCASPHLNMADSESSCGHTVLFLGVEDSLPNLLEASRNEAFMALEALALSPGDRKCFFLVLSQLLGLSSTFRGWERTGMILMKRTNTWIASEGTRKKKNKSFHLNGSKWTTSSTRKR